MKSLEICHLFGKNLTKCKIKWLLHSLGDQTSMKPYVSHMKLYFTIFQYIEVYEGSRTLVKCNLLMAVKFLGHVSDKLWIAKFHM